MSAVTSETRPAALIATPNWVQRHPLIVYFLIAFAGMWALVIPLALSTGFKLFALPEPVLTLLFILSPYPGPFLGAFVVTRATEGKAGVRHLLKRIVQWRVGVGWYLAAILSILLIWLAAYAILYNGAPLQALIANPRLLVSAFLPMIVIGLFVPSLGEEVGWRGFALPRLQRQYGPVAGTLILGVMHAIWHLPALFTANFGPLPVKEILPFLLSVIGTTFLYSWVANGARGSILIAILMHASSNAAASLMYMIVPVNEAFPAPFQALTPSWLNVILFTLAAVVLVILTRGRLGYQKSHEAE